MRPLPYDYSSPVEFFLPLVGFWIMGLHSGLANVAKDRTMAPVHQSPFQARSRSYATVLGITMRQSEGTSTPPGSPAAPSVLETQGDERSAGPTLWDYIAAAGKDTVTAPANTSADEPLAGQSYVPIAAGAAEAAPTIPLEQAAEVPAEVPADTTPMETEEGEVPTEQEILVHNSEEYEYDLDEYEQEEETDAAKEFKQLDVAEQVRLIELSRTPQPAARLSLDQEDVAPSTVQTPAALPPPPPLPPTSALDVVGRQAHSLVVQAAQQERSAPF